MIKPEKLFPLPQDVFLINKEPQSTQEEFEAFKKKLEKVKFKPLQ